MQQPDFLQFIFQAINTLLTQNLGFFDNMGQNLFRAFATILVVWFGVKSALLRAGGKHPSTSTTLRAFFSPSLRLCDVNYYSNRSLVSEPASQSHHR